MKRIKVVVSLIIGGLLAVSAVSTNAQNYSPQRTYQPAVQPYNTVPQYNSTPQYNNVPRYNSVPQYNTVSPYNTPQGTQQFQQFPPTKTSSQKSTPAWYQSLTDDREHDFGTVARASKQERIFEFVNSTDSDLFLTGVRASCGCTKPKILTQHVRPGETAKVAAVFDTLNFYGERGATVTVSLQKSGSVSEFGEIQFSVKGNIRRDVVLNPGEIVFDNVTVSEGANRTARMLYAGNAGWKIVQIKSTNPNVVAEAREVERNSTTKRVTYDLVVNLTGDQDPGTFCEFLTIMTNDAKTSGMPVSVKGMVKPRIEVSAIQLGPVNQDQTIKKKLILQSANAFAVKSIKSDDPRIKFEPAEGEKTLHILTYTLDTSSAGQIDEELTILTSDPNQPETRVPFSVQIVPATTVGRTN